MSLTAASDKILGASSLNELAAMAKVDENVTDPGALQAAATRGLKTKIRRLYDIANVFCSLDLIVKLESETRKCKPTFQWTYTKSAAQIRDQYNQPQAGDTGTEESSLSSNTFPATQEATPVATSSGTPLSAKKVLMNGGSSSVGTNALLKPSGTPPVSDKNLLANI